MDQFTEVVTTFDDGATYTEVYRNGVLVDYYYTPGEK